MIDFPICIINAKKGIFHKGKKVVYIFEQRNWPKKGTKNVKKIFDRINRMNWIRLWYKSCKSER